LSLGSDTFAWINSPWFEIGSSRFTLGKVAGLVLIVLALWWLAMILERMIVRRALRGSSAPQASPGVYAFSRIARYTVWILGTLIGLNYLGLDLTSFAFLSGAIGVGIGFGLQNIFNNFVSGIILLLERTLKVGDFVDLESGISGRVAEISMRYTRITTNRAVDVIVPNSEFINGKVTNWTFDNDLRRLHIPFGVSYNSDKEAVREAAIAAAKNVPGNIDDGLRKPDVRLVGFGDSALNFELVAWIGPEVARSPGATTAKFYWALHDELVRRNIEIPFPQRVVSLRRDGSVPSAEGVAAQQDRPQGPEPGKRV